MENLHLVFSNEPEFDEMARLLSEEGFLVIGRDYNLEQFHAAVKSRQVKSKLAFLYGPQVSISDQEYLRLIEEIRILEPSLRMVFVFSDLYESRNVITGLVELGVYDIHVREEFGIEDAVDWLIKKRSIAYARMMLAGRLDAEEEVEEESENFQMQIEPPLPEVKSEVKERKIERKRVTESDPKKRLLRFPSLKIPSIKIPSVKIRWPKMKIPKKERTAEFKDRTYEVSYNSGKTVDEIFGLKPNTIPNSSFNITNALKPMNRTQSRIIGFFSGTKGSVGKTTLSTNLAALLQRKGKKTLLIDADSGSRGATMAAFGEDRILPDISDILGGVMVDKDIHVERFVDDYEYIVIDFGNLINDETLRVLQKCDTLFLVAVPESLSVSIMKRFMEKEGRGLENEIRLIVNRYKVGEGLEPWEVGRRLGLPLTAIVPEDLETIEKAIKKRTTAVFIKENKIVAPLEEALRKSQKINEGVNVQ
ncbi:AAA family ATPase [Thermicanus aegyptius]|uniref:AAA family ATPase n=1 Tax=Thermicanus aegyptius TaxID=94009 RepID=UPI0004065176|nr:AAA family ATPase [Thermicanus aegyptius]